VGVENEEMFVCAQEDAVLEAGGIVRGRMAETGSGLWLAIGAYTLNLLKGIDVLELLVAVPEVE